MPRRRSPVKLRSRTLSRTRSRKSRSRSASKSRSLSRSKSKSRHHIRARGGMKLFVRCPKGKVYSPASDKCLRKSSRRGKRIMKKIACFKEARKKFTKCARGAGAQFV